MHRPRRGATVHRLGRALSAFGHRDAQRQGDARRRTDATPNFLTSVELYDPAANSWAPTGTWRRRGAITRQRCCATARYWWWAVARPATPIRPTPSCTTRSRQLGCGGQPHRRSLATHGDAAAVRQGARHRRRQHGRLRQLDQHLATAEIYDPETNARTSAASFTIGRNQHTATLLPNGKVLMAGASAGLLGAPVWQNQLYDVDANTWTAMAPMGGYRLHHHCHAIA